ncbi:hypothetical protein KB559_20010 [Paenibacillus sp. Marseille-P2973]|uniref:Uncharacterized protein n=1 Tax=Paenibacillus vini TaxID=1476024 RepID=A0ABQ4MF32_9BACL|nr:hypothetical protein [Paenibacillus sp. Marseille-P2973]GIP54583.1 hypothetical protein J42TS3_36180 [Paenibacillus vini]
MKSTPEEALEAADESRGKAPSPKLVTPLQRRQAGAVPERDRTVMLILHREKRVELSYARMVGCTV